MEVLMLGDTHGNLQVIEDALYYAVEYDCEKVIQLGDFGIGDWGTPGRNKLFIDLIEQVIERTDIPLYFIDGNHDDHDIIDSWGFVPNAQGHKEIANNLFYIPRGTVWEWEDRVWQGLGGAYSIDKSMRVPGVSWWEQETPTFRQIQDAVDNAAGLEVDFLLTHDAPVETPWPKQLIPIQESLNVRNDISALVKSVRPKMLFHGHYHMVTDWTMEYDVGHTKVHGLDFENNFGSMGVLDTETYTFTHI